MSFQALFQTNAWGDSDASGEDLSRELIAKPSKKKKKAKNKLKPSEKALKMLRKDKDLLKTHALKAKKKQIIDEIVKTQVTDILSNALLKKMERKKRKTREIDPQEPKKKRLKKILKQIDIARANGIDLNGLASSSGLKNGSKLPNGRSNSVQTSSSDSSDSGSESDSSEEPEKPQVPPGILKKVRIEEPPATTINLEDIRMKYLKNQKRQKILEAIKEKEKERVKEKEERPPEKSLRQKMMEKLKAARFRFLNEQIYTTSSKEAQKIFVKDPDAFVAYHEGYRQQVKRWPVNPLDVIIKSIQKMPEYLVIADFGCGEAKLAKSLPHTVHSFDFVAINEHVTACNMAHTPLKPKSVDVAVFCLSLMGTDMKDYLLEANRVLKTGGILKIAEVESRFAKKEDFLKALVHFGFDNVRTDKTHNLFFFLDFKKTFDITNMKKLPNFILHPCMYKKR